MKTDVNLKKHSEKVKEVSGGLISLSQKEGSLFKKALICRTGIFDGMYGQAIVTENLLRGIAARYNKEKENPRNENDYAPILKEHVRDADLTMGRIMADMTVEEIDDPLNTGAKCFGLFASLRFDDEDAKAKVDSGKYSHLSISFDEDTFEFYETSVVAVEAARGAIILSQNKKENLNMDFKAKFNSLSKRHKSLAAKIEASRKARGVRLSKITTEQAAISTEATALNAKMGEISLTLKQGQVRAQLAAFVPQGKMTPAELKGFDFKALAAMPADSLKIVLSSYENRAVSTDVRQLGQSVTTEAQSATVELPKDSKKVAELVKQQLAAKGKKVKLEQADPVGGADKSDVEGEEKKSYSMGEEDYASLTKDLAEVGEKLTALMGKFAALGAEASEMLKADEDEKEELSKLAADDKSDDEEKGDE